VSQPIVRGVALLAAALWVLTGCTSTVAPTTEAAPAATGASATASAPLFGPTPKPFPLPTSDWQAGDPAFGALKFGLLRREGRCLVVGPARNPTVLLWPAGFTALRLPTGVVQVSNAEQTIVATSGETLSTGGGEGGGGGWDDQPCIARYAKVFVINDTMAR
jgi:hypothetical protein